MLANPGRDVWVGTAQHRRRQLRVPRRGDLRVADHAGGADRRQPGPAGQPAEPPRPVHTGTAIPSRAWTSGPAGSAGTWCARPGAKRAFSAAGEVRLVRATIGRQLTFAGAELGDPDGPHDRSALNAFGAQTQELLAHPGPPARTAGSACGSCAARRWTTTRRCGGRTGGDRPGCLPLRLADQGDRPGRRRRRAAPPAVAAGRRTRRVQPRPVRPACRDAALGGQRGTRRHGADRQAASPLFGAGQWFPRARAAGAGVELAAALDGRLRLPALPRPRLAGAAAGDRHAVVRALPGALRPLPSATHRTSSTTASAR